MPAEPAVCACFRPATAKKQGKRNNVYGNHYDGAAIGRSLEANRSIHGKRGGAGDFESCRHFDLGQAIRFADSSEVEANVGHGRSPRFGGSLDEG